VGAVRKGRRRGLRLWAGIGVRVTVCRHEQGDGSEIKIGRRRDGGDARTAKSAEEKRCVARRGGEREGRCGGNGRRRGIGNGGRWGGVRGGRWGRRKVSGQGETSEGGGGDVIRGGRVIGFG